MQNYNNGVSKKAAVVSLLLAQTMALRQSPATTLAQKSDTPLLDNNVSIEHLKNLVTDKPAPITVALAQSKKSDTPLLDNNVSIEHLKNLITDKPAPITVALA